MSRFGYKQYRGRTKTPTQLTITHCKEMGYSLWMAEQRSMYGHVTHDLLGCIDIIALIPGPKVSCLGIQATSLNNLNSRIEKIQKLEHDCAKLWTQAGNMLQVWGWDVKREAVDDGVFKTYRNDHYLTKVDMDWTGDAWTKRRMVLDEVALAEIRVRKIKWEKARASKKAGGATDASP